MANPWDKDKIVAPAWGNDRIIIPGSGPKPPSGFSTPGAAPMAPIEGGPDSISYIRQKALTEAAARTGVEVSAAIREAYAKGQIDLNNAIAKAKAENEIKSGNIPLTAAERDKAIAGYHAATLLDQSISDMKRLYAEGPGRTSGMAGLRDYLPTTSNYRFDNAGNSARGIVGQALGFTGGQLNTEVEAAKAVGPYLPQAGDRDEVILDKIKRLEDLRDTARARAVAQLGGVPDQNGRVTPVNAGAPAAAPAAPPNAVPPAAGPAMPPAAPPSDGGGTPPVGGGGPLATGPTKTVADPRTATLIDTLVRKGATADEINTTLKSLGFPGDVQQAHVDAIQAFLKANPGYTKSVADMDRKEPTTILNRMAASPGAAFFLGGLNGVTGGLLDEGVGAADSAFNGRPINQAIADANQRKQAAFAANPTASLLGNVAGGVGGMMLAGGAARGLGLTSMLGKSAPLLGDLAYGAASGAGENNDNRLLGAGVGAGASLVGRGLFGGAARLAGRATRGVQNAEVRYLRDAGVPLTTGQVLGNSGRTGAVIKGLEDRLSDIPVVGDVLKARRTEGFQGYNRAAFDDGLTSIGASTNGVVAEPGIDLARMARTKAYSDALDPVSLQVDPQFQTADAALRQNVAALPGDMAARGSYALDRAAENFDPAGNLSGRGFQQALRRFRRATSENKALPNGGDLGDLLGNAEDAYTGLLSRQSPGALPAFNAANMANRNVEVLRDAVNRARNGSRTGETGLFSASQLADAAAANARKFGNTQGTTAQPFFNLTRAGQSVLPSTVPNSGTAGRLATLALPATLGSAGAGTGYAGGDTRAGAEAGLGAGALLALAGTKGGQSVLTKMLLDRPDLLKQLGNQIVDRVPIPAGMFGRSLGTQTGLAVIR